MKIKILFIEDNKTKADDVKLYLNNNYDDIDIVIKESFTSGLKELFKNDYSLLLLDMSLPTRDGSPNNSINNFEQLGGHKILSEIKRKKKYIPTILITMFSEFGVGKSFMDIKELDEVLQTSFESFYKGLVYYSSREDNWQNKLKNHINNIIE